MLHKIGLAALLGAFIGVTVPGSSAVAGDEAKAYGEVAKRLPSAKVTLQRGIAASESTGQPISAKFEVDEGRFQLSVYTSKGGAFYEVAVDHMSGVVAKSEKISEADDLKAAKAQMAAISKAKKTLKTVADEAEQALAGYRAISATPSVKAGHAVAVVVLLKGSEVKSVTESLE